MNLRGTLPSPRRRPPFNNYCNRSPKFDSQIGLRRSIHDCKPSNIRSTLTDSSQRSLTWQMTPNSSSSLRSPNSIYVDKARKKEDAVKTEGFKRGSRVKSVTYDLPVLSKTVSLLDVRKESFHKSAEKGVTKVPLRPPSTTKTKEHPALKPSVITTERATKAPYFKFEDDKRLKKEFLKFESVCSELLLLSKNSPSTSYRTALNFYKLLLTLYHSIQEINKETLKNDQETSDGSKETKESKGGKETHDIKYDSSRKNLNKVSAFKMIHQLNMDRSAQSKVPLKVDNDRIKIGELLSYPKVHLKSKSVVRVFEDLVEEQYLICAERPIREKERGSLDTSNMGDWRPRYKHVTIECLFKSDTSAGGYHGLIKSRPSSIEYVLETQNSASQQPSNGLFKSNGETSLYDYQDEEVTAHDMDIIECNINERSATRHMEEASSLSEELIPDISTKTFDELPKTSSTGVKRMNPDRKELKSPDGDNVENFPPEGLLKLQKILEYIPKEKIDWTLSALDKVESNCSNNLTLSEERGNGYKVNYATTKGLKDVESVKEDVAEEGPSEMVSSLILFESLIDDFLAKNGLSNITDI